MSDHPIFLVDSPKLLSFYFRQLHKSFFFLESLMGIFYEEQRKTFLQIWVKISLCTSFPMNSYRNTEANHGIAFYPTKSLAVFSTGYHPWKHRCFRYLLSVFTTSFKVGWAQIVTSALRFPHSCFKISYQNVAVPLGWDRKKNPWETLVFPFHILSLFLQKCHRLCLGKVYKNSTFLSPQILNLLLEFSLSQCHQNDSSFMKVLNPFIKMSSPKTVSCLHVQDATTQSQRDSKRLRKFIKFQSLDSS